ncbi:MAG: nucleotide sugar dehydrogenase [Actinobacteria bacterium]|jgi:UDP-N-acetyl-D-glucosamine dehydrogenase|nr:MAG: nucleotide sugar dehydrogenase [Actinomycetota bacterium]
MSLEESIKGRGALVGIIGLGYVGLPLAVEAAGAGFRVIGLERDAGKRKKLARGELFYEGMDGERMARLLGEDMLRITGDSQDLLPCEVVCICVPTPLSRTRDPDLGFVRMSARQIEGLLREGVKPKLVIVESTSYPGTTREVVRPILEANGMRPCADFHLAYSPERVDPGNARWTIANTPKLVGGMNGCCTALAEAFYAGFVQETVRVSSPEVAEMAKVLENIFRGVNIALVNELWMLCERMGLDVWEVIDAAATKPFGFMPFWPGPGLGGHCIPVDPFYLAWKAREYDFQTEFIELAGKINVNMPYFVSGLVARRINEAGKSLKGARVLVSGVAYKPDVGDTRETPAAKLMELLREGGADVIYHDPFVPVFTVGETTLRSVELIDDTLSGCDCVVIVTAHSGVDYELIARSGVPILDTRNVLHNHGVSPGHGTTTD